MNARIPKLVLFDRMVLEGSRVFEGWSRLRTGRDGGERSEKFFLWGFGDGIALRAGGYGLLSAGNVGARAGGSAELMQSLGVPFRGHGPGRAVPVLCLCACTAATLGTMAGGRRVRGRRVFGTFRLGMQRLAHVGSAQRDDDDGGDIRDSLTRTYRVRRVFRIVLRVADGWGLVGRDLDFGEGQGEG